MPLITRAERRRVATETITETPFIIAAHADQGATTASTFYTSPPRLSPADSPGFTGQRFTRVVAADSFSAARTLISEHGALPSKTAVLNLASDETPGGGWLMTLCETQEEALCYSSTLYATLNKAWYPWSNRLAGGGFSPGVVVHRKELREKAAPLPAEERVVLGVITVAAPCCPKLSPDRKEFFDEEMTEVFREKVRAVLRIAGAEGRTNVVLGAMGCGAYGCPNRAVAREMASVMREEEWKGWFERVWWAVFDPLGEQNCGVFGEICDGIELP